MTQILQQSNQKTIHRQWVAVLNNFLRQLVEQSIVLKKRITFLRSHHTLQTSSKVLSSVELVTKLNLENRSRIQVDNLCQIAFLNQVQAWIAQKLLKMMARFPIYSLLVLQFHSIQRETSMQVLANVLTVSRSKNQFSRKLSRFHLIFTGLQIVTGATIK